jgi:hypothetical protein
MRIGQDNTSTAGHALDLEQHPHLGLRRGLHGCAAREAEAGQQRDRLGLRTDAVVTRGGPRPRLAACRGAGAGPAAAPRGAAAL